MTEKKLPAAEDQAVEKTEDHHQNRRQALKKAGVTGGLLAGTVWAKPVINTVVLPAHATTSEVAPDDGETGPEPITLTGPTGNSATFGAAPGKEADTSIVERVVETLIPSAAAAGVPPLGPSQFAQNPSGLGLCVTLEFPEGNTPSGPINVMVDGPTVDYYYNGPGSYNLSSSGSGTLNGVDFDVNLGGTLRVSGCLSDDDFTGATGYVSMATQVPAVYSGFLTEFTGYGAPFDAGLDVACSPGTGVVPA